MIVIGLEIAIVILLLLSAFFSSAETALFSLNPLQIHRIRRSKPREARAIEALLATPTHLLSTILIGNTLVNIAASDIAFILAENFWPDHGAQIAIPAMTFILIIVGEVTPKRIAMRLPETLAILYLRPLYFFIWLLTPLRTLLDWITQAFERTFKSRRPVMTGEELLTVVDVGHEEGILNKEERVMVDGILRLENIQARDVMTPRVDLIGIDINGDPSRFAHIARQGHFHYLPVYRDSLDNVEGFLNVPQFLLSQEPDIKAAMLPHYYVPDTVTLDTLLTTFQQQNRRLAVVIDEYGGTAGMITRGDILDEIVESVHNEFGAVHENIQPNGANRWLIEGATSLEEINYELDLHLEAQGADRIAGWFTYHAEHIPRMGESIEAQGCRVTVQAMKKHRITLLAVERLSSPPEENSDL